MAERLDETEKEVTKFTHGPLQVELNEEGVSVNRQVNLD